MPLFPYLKEDIRRASKITRGGPAQKMLACFLSPGVRAVVVFRFGQWVYRRKGLRRLLTPVYFIMYQRIRTRWGIQIPRSVKIGKGFYIGHFGGIIIAPKVRIGSNVNISQGVTIGRAGKGAKRGSPVIGNNVYIAPGVKLFGNIKIGDSVKIGANAIVYKDIPDNAIVALTPGFEILSYKGNVRAMEADEFDFD